MKAYFLLEHSDLKLEKKVQQQICVKPKINFLKKIHYTDRQNVDGETLMTLIYIFEILDHGIYYLQAKYHL